ncbi:MAG: glycosyltransferase family 4 protein [Hyphomonadaceae bacterium]|nr:glycosyltransferase family 4 protein [Hyphomonadaceae bacterium]
MSKIFLHDYAGHPFQAELSRALAARGHQITHAYFEGDAGPKGALEHAAGDPGSLTFAPVGIGETYSKTSFARRRFQDLSYGRAAAAAIVAARPQIVVSGNTPTESQVYIHRAARQVGARFIYWCQDFYSIAVSKILSKKIPVVGAGVGLYYIALERAQMRDADAVILITEDFAPQTRAWGVDPAKLHVIPNWGAIDQIPIMPKTNAWAAEHGLNGKTVLMYTGTLGLKHNPDLLIELARRYRDRPDVVVVVVAAGIGVSRLEAAKAAESLDNLRLLPLQPFDRLAEVLASADVLAAVIERDAGEFSVPSKVLSYLCAGRPVLLAAPQANLAAKTIAAERCGLVCEPEDVAGWVAAADRLLKDGAEAGVAGRAYAERNFVLSRVADRFETVFEAALARAR